MSSPSPLVLGAVAIGALLFMRSRAQAQPRALGAGQKTADYFTPTDVAASLSRLVVGITKGIQTPAPAGIFAVDHPITAGTSASGLAGWERYSAGSASGDPYNAGDSYESWTAPSSSSVGAATARAPIVDQVIAAPVYNLNDDFANNPFLLAAP